MSSIRNGFLYEYFHEEHYDVPTMTALRQGRYKLVRYPSHPAWTELFDLRADPYETNNLARDPSARGLARHPSNVLTEKKTFFRYGFRVMRTCALGAVAQRPSNVRSGARLPPHGA